MDEISKNGRKLLKKGKIKKDVKKRWIDEEEQWFVNNFKKMTNNCNCRCKWGSAEEMNKDL